MVDVPEDAPSSNTSLGTGHTSPKKVKDLLPSILSARPEPPEGGDGDGGGPGFIQQMVVSSLEDMTDGEKKELVKFFVSTLRDGDIGGMLHKAGVFDPMLDEIKFLRLEIKSLKKALK